ncbi:hypothetical protein J2S00_003079 [Caldalkalibacillus uzonensis]|uniref:Phage tail tape measure protein n=2 Tax=Caldalkalibacillus uzonensis TaxID=353224 RepID=A0ABU0CVC1_9BACI|nr:hypothetical protein [Caldalkalibacillus uzonensis]
MIDDKEAQKSLSKTDKNAQTLAQRLGSMIKTAAKWGAAIVSAAGAAVAGLFGLTLKATEAADAIAKGAARMGVSTDFYQELTYWASQNGIAHEKMEKAVGSFNQRLGLAMNGNEKYASALHRLGINLDEVRSGTLSTEDAFTRAIQTLSEMTNEHEKAELATEMFGSAIARELLPALQDGSLSIDEARQKAHELGLVLAEDQLRAAEKFQDSWDTIKRSLGAAVTQIGLDLMPMFQTMLDWVLENLPAIRQMFTRVSEGIQTAVGWIVEGIQSVIGYIRDWRQANEGALSAIWERISSTLPTILEIFKNIFRAVWEVVKVAFEIIQTIVQTVLNLVVPFIQAKLKDIQQFWQENGQQIMQAVQNAFKFIQSVIEFVMPAVLFIIKMVWGSIQGIFNGALNIIMGLLKTFAGLFTGDWSKMWEGIKQFLGGALQFIWGLIQLTLLGRVMRIVRSFATMLRNAISSPFNWMRDFINTVLSAVTSRASSFASGFVNAFRAIPNGIRSVLNSVINFFNRMIRGLNNFRLNIPSWVPGMGGKSFGINLRPIPALAKGGNIVQSGRVLVGEAGPEILDLPRGARVTPLDRIQEGGKIEVLLTELIQAVREGKNIIMDDYLVGKIVEKHITEIQNRNREVRERFAT